MDKIKKYLKNEKGFTLIELLVYIGLLGIFLFTLTNLFVSSIDVRLESEAKSSVDQDSRYLMTKLRYDIINASSIVTPTAPGDNDSSLELVRDGVTYTYSLLDGDLVLSDAVNSDQINSSRTSVSNINFARLGNIGGLNTITITYTLESKISRPQGVESRDYAITYAIR